jgi:hypothetical protein
MHALMLTELKKKMCMNMFSHYKYKFSLLLPSKHAAISMKLFIVPVFECLLKVIFNKFQPTHHHCQVTRYRNQKLKRIYDMPDMEKVLY